MKKFLIAVVAVFICWSVMDFIIHNILLGSTYAATAEMWRPMEEMKMGLMYFVTLVVAAVFVRIYSGFFADKTLKSGLLYGALWGVGMGMSMGYGSYAYLPIPYVLAISWFTGTVVEGLAAGAIIGWIFKES